MSHLFMRNELNEVYNERRVNASLKKVEEKWKLVPAFLRLRGLTKQHIDSFNYFINVDMKRMVAANNVITLDDPAYRDHYLKFVDIRVGTPVIEENFGKINLTPH